MNPLPIRNRRADSKAGVVLALCFCALAATAWVAGAAGLHYKGQVLYRADRKPAPGLLVELVEAGDDGKPADEVLGSAHADAEGRFVVAMEKATNGPVAIVVSAVRESADSSGDRRSEGYTVRTQRTRLGFIANPSPTKSNTVLIERRKAGGSADRD